MKFSLEQERKLYFNETFAKLEFQQSGLMPL